MLAGLFAVWAAITSRNLTIDRDFYRHVWPTNDHASRIYREQLAKADREIRNDVKTSGTPFGAGTAACKALNECEVPPRGSGLPGCTPRPECAPPRDAHCRGAERVV
jgi:hypothetical protein